jgi:predicted kinase
MSKNFLQNFQKCEIYPNTLDLEFLNSIHYFNALSNCEQNPRWHAEGNAQKHSLLAYEKLIKEVVYGKDYHMCDSLNDIELLILKASVLLHDIGKSVTTTIGKDGNWHSYNHEIEGEKIARVLLWNENFYIRETICALIKYHMEPLRIFNSKNWIARMYEIACVVPWKLLYCVKLSDLLGSVQSTNNTQKEDLEKLELLKETAKTLKIWDDVDSEGLHSIVKYTNKNLLPWRRNMNPNKIAYIMIGLPGSGKNTYINKNILTIHPDSVQISRDDIRIQLGYCNENEKYLGNEEEENEVTRVFDEIFDNAILNGKKIILNNTFLKKKYREPVVTKLINNGYKIIYVYVEAPTLEINYKRRDGEVPQNVINRMALNFEYPEVTEFDEIIFDKQTF